MAGGVTASYKFIALTFTGKCNFLKLHLIQEMRKLVSKVGTRWREEGGKIWEKRFRSQNTDELMRNRPVQLKKVPV